MKRITQILASTLFVITVLTVYLAFDFAINNAVSHRNPSRKRSHHEHDDHHGHDHPKNLQKQPIPVLSRTAKSNGTNNLNNNERHTRHVDQPPPALRPKPGNFHKGKTGVKVNKPQKVIKDQRKRSTTTTTTMSQNKGQHHVIEKRRV
jgi:hypothetical protein